MKNNISKKLLEKLINQAASAGDINKVRTLLIAGAPLSDYTMELASEADPIKAGLLAMDIEQMQKQEQMDQAHARIFVSKKLKTRRKLLGLGRYA